MKKAALIVTTAKCFMGLAGAASMRPKTQTNSSSTQNQSKGQNQQQQQQQQNVTLSDLIYWEPHLLYTQLFQASNCSIPLQNLISQYNSTSPSSASSNASASGSGLTIFAPIDSAWNSTFNMRNFSGFYNCSGNSTLPTDCLSLFNSTQMKTMDPNELGDCLGVLAAYLVIPGIQSNLSLPREARHTNVFVLQTSLNSTAQQNQTQEQGQEQGQGRNASIAGNITEFSSLVANKTQGYTVLMGGGNSSAVILDARNATDGELYLLDNFLLPPLPLQNTLQAWDLSIPPELNQTLTQMNLTNSTFTLFLPQDVQQLMNQPDFNISKFIPQIIYLNQTEPTTMNYTAINGFPLLLNMSLVADEATINDTATVLMPNIPFDQGVIHLISNTGLMNQINNTGAEKAGNMTAQQASSPWYLIA